MIFSKLCLWSHITCLWLSYLDFKLGLRLYTGDAKLDGENSGKDMDLGPNGTYVGANASKYRLGALSVGVNGYEVGMSSERIRNATQNWWHDRKFMHTARFSVLPYIRKQFSIT